MKAFLFFLLFVGSAASCQNTDETQNITSEDLEIQFEAIKKLVNESSCDDNSQCRYIAYGTKACGGPQGYLLYSSSIDTEKLETLVAKYSRDEDSYNKQNGIMSDCSIPSPPEKLDCADGKCIALD